MNTSILKKYKELPVEIKAAFWFLIGTFFQKAMSMVSTPIFTRIMSAEEYGEYNVFNSWFVILGFEFFLLLLLVNYLREFIHKVLLSLIRKRGNFHRVCKD